MYKFKPGFYADVRIEDRYNTFISYRDGRLEDCREASLQRAFIRVFDGQMWYYASTSRLEDIQSELDALYLMGRPDCDIEANEIVKRFQINRDKKLKFSDRRVKDISIQDKREFLYAQSSLFQGRYQKSLTACYLDKYTLHSFYSSKGAELEHDFQTAGIACNLGLGFNGESFEEQFSRAAVSFMELKQKVSQVDIKEFI